MKIPYFKQQTEYTCGPACVRMILASYGVNRSEKVLAKMMKTNKMIGTDSKNMVDLFEKYGFDYIVRRHGRISLLRRYYKRGWKVIVCFQYEGVSHYSVIKKINWHSVYFLNPYQDRQEERFLITKFKRHWKDRHGNPWFIAVKKQD